MSDHLYTYPNRTLCSVLEDVRKANETRNYSYLMGLVEEAQYLANRMESALGDARDIRDWTEKRSRLKHEIRKLQKERDALKPEGTTDDK